MANTGNNSIYQGQKEELTEHNSINRIGDLKTPFNATEVILGRDDRRQGGIKAPQEIQVVKGEKAVG